MKTTCKVVILFLFFKHDPARWNKILNFHENVHHLVLYDLVVKKYS